MKIVYDILTTIYFVAVPLDGAVDPLGCLKLLQELGVLKLTTPNCLTYIYPEYIDRGFLSCRRLHMRSNYIEHIQNIHSPTQHLGFGLTKTYTTSS